MNCVKAISAGALSLLLYGCAVAPVGDYGFEKHDDPYRPYIAILGTPVTRTVSAPMQPLTRVTIALEARRDRKTNLQTLYANVQVHYANPGMRRYTTARNNRAELIPLHLVNHTSSHCLRDVGCMHTEWLLIDLNEGELRSVLSTGYPLKIFGKGGEELWISFSPEMLRGFFRALDNPAAAPPVAKPSAARL